MSRYIGLDLSLTSPGFACVDVIDRKPILIATDNIKTTAKDRDGVRLRKIATKLKSFVAEHEPIDTFIKEQSFARFNKETHQIYKTVGVVLYVLHSHDVPEIANTTVKKQMTGNGKASKEEVAKAVCDVFDLPRDTYAGRDDESDAIAVVLAYLIKNDLIDWED